MDIDTRLLRYFVTVAEELSFTRAAERLYLSQPTLSRQMSRLERDLGVPLFVRTSRRRIELTEGAQALLPHARGLVESWATGLRETRSAGHGRRVLRVGFEATAAGPLTTRIRAELGRRQPDVVVVPRRFDWGGEADALRDGRVDVAFVWLPNDMAELDSEVVATECRMLGVHSGHRLAGRSQLRIAEVGSEPIAWTRRAPRQWVDWWAVNPRPDGSEPNWGPANNNVEEMLELVASGEAVCISPASMAQYYSHPGIRWSPIVDIEPLRIAIAWPAESRDPIVAAFVRLASELSRDLQQSSEGRCDPPSARRRRTGGSQTRSA